MMTDIGELEAVSQQSTDEYNERQVNLDLSKATEQLTKGLLSIYQVPLENVKKELYDFTTKQEALVVHMQIENKKLLDLQEDAELNEMVSIIGTCHEKLGTIKKNMFTLHDKAVKLKKRAIRLQQLKEKEVHKHEEEITRRPSS